MDWKNGNLRSVWKGNKEKILFLFCSGLLLFVISLPDGKKSGTDWKQTSAEAAAADAETEEAAGTGISSKMEISYEEQLETRIGEILANVDGVGEADVMVVLKSSEEKILHVDKSSTSSVTEDNTGTRGSGRTVREEQESESTVLDGKSQSPVVEKEMKPEISGIIISADGGGSAVIRAEISEAMEALFGLPANKVKVMKRAAKNP